VTHQSFPKPEPKRKKRPKPLPRHSAKGEAYEDELAEVKLAVFARAKYRCEIGLEGCTVGITSTPHHRKRRTQGGPNTMANLLACCEPCHTKVHKNPEFSYARGLLIRRHEKITPFAREKR
jgi:5-methylcytosine-specific restriction endonuclease McrA